MLHDPSGALGTYKVAFDSRSREVAQGDDKHHQNTNAEQGSEKHYKECSTCAIELRRARPREI